MNDGSTFDTNLFRLRAIEADIRAGKLRQAAEALNALYTDTPSDARVYLTAAMLARAAKNPQREIWSLQRAVTLSPRWLPVHIELAKALSREGRHDEAVAAANTAVELDPEEMMTLEVAVAIANAAGDSATALRHLQIALALRPTDASINRSLGICLAEQSRHGEAEAHCRAVLAESPDDPLALRCLGICLVELNRKDEACAALERMLAQFPGEPISQFYLAIARGETPRTQPEDMPRSLFDEFASQFDTHLVGQLKYRVPKRVAEIIAARQPGRNISVLDLGCGTGLLGVCLGHVEGAFVGVDLSAKMIEQAARHGIYTAFRLGNLRDELQRVSPDSFDYVTANDVFIYVGDLSDVIPATFKALRSGGALIFSCEAADESEDAIVLRPSKRYAHSRGSVEMLCRDAGFSSCTVEPIELRLERNVPLAGFIAVAEKR